MGGVKKLLVSLAVTVALALVPTAAASPTVRLAILHVVSGCHVWATADSKPLGRTRTITVARGTKLEIRINCPMAFDMTQLKGPQILKPSRWETGTSHSLTFTQRGVYSFQGKNVQSSDEMNLETLGPDNTVALTVRVR
jgi:hypothetical protein